MLAGEYEWASQAVSEPDSARPCTQCCHQCVDELQGVARPPRANLLDQTLHRLDFCLSMPVGDVMIG